MRFNKIQRNILKTMEQYLTFYKESRQIMLKSFFFGPVFIYCSGIVRNRKMIKWLKLSGGTMLFLIIAVQGKSLFIFHFHVLKLTNYECHLHALQRERNNSVLCALHTKVISITLEEDNSVCIKLIYITFGNFSHSHHSSPCQGCSLKLTLLVTLCVI